MPVVATDNFNRANGGLGANWTTQTAYTAPLIVSNAIQSLALTDYAAVYTAADAGSDDMYCKVDSTVVTQNANNDNIVWVRMPNTGAETGYMADSPSYATKDWTLQKATAGVFTVLATGGGVAVAASTFSLQVQAVGTTISASRGGTSLASVTDSTFSGSSNRYAGIHVYADSTNFCSIDNFEMGNFIASAPAGRLVLENNSDILLENNSIFDTEGS